MDSVYSALAQAQESARQAVGALRDSVSASKVHKQRCQELLQAANNVLVQLQLDAFQRPGDPVSQLTAATRLCVAAERSRTCVDSLGNQGSFTARLAAPFQRPRSVRMLSDELRVFHNLLGSFSCSSGSGTERNQSCPLPSYQGQTPFIRNNSRNPQSISGPSGEWHPGSDMPITPISIDRSRLTSTPSVVITMRPPPPSPGGASDDMEARALPFVQRRVRCSDNNPVQRLCFMRGAGGESAAVQLMVVLPKQTEIYSAALDSFHSDTPLEKEGQVVTSAALYEPTVDLITGHRGGTVLVYGRVPMLPTAPNASGSLRAAPPDTASPVKGLPLVIHLSRHPITALHCFPAFELETGPSGLADANGRAGPAADAVPDAVTSDAPPVRSPSNSGTGPGQGAVGAEGAAAAAAGASGVGRSLTIDDVLLFTGDASGRVMAIRYSRVQPEILAAQVFNAGRRPANRSGGGTAGGGAGSTTAGGAATNASGGAPSSVPPILPTPSSEPPVIGPEITGLLYRAGNLIVSTSNDCLYSIRVVWVPPARGAGPPGSATTTGGAGSGGGVTAQSNGGGTGSGEDNDTVPPLNLTPPVSSGSRPVPSSSLRASSSVNLLSPTASAMGRQGSLPLGRQGTSEAIANGAGSVTATNATTTTNGAGNTTATTATNNNNGAFRRGTLHLTTSVADSFAFPGYGACTTMVALEWGDEDRTVSAGGRERVVSPSVGGGSVGGAGSLSAFASTATALMAASGTPLDNVSGSTSMKAFFSDNPHGTWGPPPYSTAGVMPPPSVQTLGGLSSGEGGRRAPRSSWRMLSAHTNGQLLMWDVSPWRLQLVCAIGDLGPPIISVFLFPDLGTMVELQSSGHIRVGPLPTSSLAPPMNPLGGVPVWRLGQTRIRAHQGRITAGAALRNAIATGSRAGGVRVWSAMDLRERAKAQGINFLVPGGRALLAGSPSIRRLGPLSPPSGPSTNAGTPTRSDYPIPPQPFPYPTDLRFPPTIVAHTSNASGLGSMSSAAPPPPQSTFPPFSHLNCDHGLTHIVVPVPPPNGTGNAQHGLGGLALQLLPPGPVPNNEMYRPQRPYGNVMQTLYSQHVPGPLLDQHGGLSSNGPPPAPVVNGGGMGPHPLSGGGAGGSGMASTPSNAMGSATGGGSATPAGEGELLDTASDVVLQRGGGAQQRPQQQLDRRLVQDSGRLASSQKVNSTVAVLERAFNLNQTAGDADDPHARDGSITSLPRIIPWEGIAVGEGDSEQAAKGAMQRQRSTRDNGPGPTAAGLGAIPPTLMVVQGSPRGPQGATQMHGQAVGVSGVAGGYAPSPNCSSPYPYMPNGWPIPQPQSALQHGQQQQQQPYWPPPSPRANGFDGGLHNTGYQHVPGTRERPLERRLSTTSDYDPYRPFEEVPSDMGPPPAPVLPPPAPNRDLHANQAASQINPMLQNCFIAPPDLRLLEPVGEGAEGTVWRGRWFHIDVAIKEMHPTSPSFGPLVSIAKDLSSAETAGHSEVLTGVVKEVAALIDLGQHPNIIRFVGVCIAPPRIITEYYKMGSLFSMLKEARQGNQRTRKKLTWMQRLVMLQDIAAGMAYLHSRSYVHGDLRSPNVFVTEDQRLKIGDFGFARILSGAQDGTPVPARLTNPRWQAPEVYAMTESEATTAADVYSFGIIMYEVLTFNQPYDDVPDDRNVKCRHMLQPSWRPQVPEPRKLPVPTNIHLAAYLTLMQDCWAVDSNDRPQFYKIAERLMALIRWQRILSYVRQSIKPFRNRPPVVTDGFRNEGGAHAEAASTSATADDATLGAITASVGAQGGGELSQYLHDVADKLQLEPKPDSRMVQGITEEAMRASPAPPARELPEVGAVAVVAAAPVATSAVQRPGWASRSGGLEPSPNPSAKGLPAPAWLRPASPTAGELTLESVPTLASSGSRPLYVKAAPVVAPAPVSSVPAPAPGSDASGFTTKKSLGPGADGFGLLSPFTHIGSLSDDEEDAAPVLPAPPPSGTPGMRPAVTPPSAPAAPFAPRAPPTSPSPSVGVENGARASVSSLQSLGQQTSSNAAGPQTAKVAPAARVGEVATAGSAPADGGSPPLDKTASMLAALSSPSDPFSMPSPFNAVGDLEDSDDEVPPTTAAPAASTATAAASPPPLRTVKRPAATAAAPPPQPVRPKAAAAAPAPPPPAAAARSPSPPPLHSGGGASVAAALAVPGVPSLASVSSVARTQNGGGAAAPAPPPAAVAANGGLEPRTSTAPLLPTAISGRQSLGPIVNDPFAMMSPFNDMGLDSDDE